MNPSSRPASPLLTTPQHNWDPSSPLPTTTQRQQLVRAFIQSDPPATSPTPITPSPEQISTILEPWRPQKLRQIAHKHANSGSRCEFYFLRTHYGDRVESDPQMAKWLKRFEDCMSADLMPEDWWYTVLDDAELFEVGEGEKWEEKVYDAFPELAAPRAAEMMTDTDVYYIGDKLEWLTPDGVVEEEDLAEAVRSIMRHGGTWLVLIDQEAFDTGQLGLVFRDVKGNVIRHGPVDADDLNDLKIYELRGDLDEQWYWSNAEIGEKYRLGGEVLQGMVDAIKETYL